MVLMLRQRLVPEQRRLHQKGVKLLAGQGRRQPLLGWKHQLRYWSRCCRRVSRTWRQQMGQWLR